MIATVQNIPIPHQMIDSMIYVKPQLQIKNKFNIISIAHNDCKRYHIEQFIIKYFNKNEKLIESKT